MSLSKSILTATKTNASNICIRSASQSWHSVAGLTSLHRVGCRSPLVSLHNNQHTQLNTLFFQYRAIGPRQYAPKGFREAAGRAPMTYEFGEECNELAKVAHQTKNYGDAISLYDRALTMRRERYGPIHEKCAATLHNIGRVFLDMREYGAAENAFTEAAAIYEEKEGKTSLRYTESLALLALTYTHLQFLDEAEKAFRESIKNYRDMSYNHVSNSWLPDDANKIIISEPQKHPLASAAHALADCAQLFLLQNQEHRAIAFLEESLEIRRFLYSKHHKYRPMIAQTLNKLCELKKMINDSTGAELCIEECIEICTSTLGRDSPATAQAISSKASLLASRRQFREARRLYEESSATYSTTLGKDSELYGLELIKLGRIQELCDDHIIAQKTYEKGIEIISESPSLGRDSLQLAEAYTFLGSLLVKRQESAEATKLFQTAIRIRKNKNKKDPQLAYLYQKLGDVYAMRRESHAEAYFLLSIEQFRENSKIEPLQRTFLTDVLDDLGLFYLDFHHYDKAERCLKEALDTRIEMLGESHATVAYSYSNFALLYLHREDAENSEKMCTLALDMYAKTARSNILAQADVYTTYAQCCHLQKRYRDALEWHEKALNVRRTRGESSEISTAESMNHIARVYISMKKYAPATKYVAEAKKIAYQFKAEVTQYLRQEVAKTEQQIPPVEEWSEEDHLAASFSSTAPPVIAC